MIFETRKRIRQLEAQLALVTKKNHTLAEQLAEARKDVFRLEWKDSDSKSAMERNVEYLEREVSHLKTEAESARRLYLSRLKRIRGILIALRVRSPVDGVSIFDTDVIALINNEIAAAQKKVDPPPPPKPKLNSTLTRYPPFR